MIDEISAKVVTEIIKRLAHTDERADEELATLPSGLRKTKTILRELRDHPVCSSARSG